MTKGVKYDQGKLRYDLVPVGVHEGLCDVITYGAAKYDDNNWMHVEPKRYEAALFRHINAWRKGEKNDSESGKHHLFHAMACLAFLVEHENLEDKPTNECKVYKGGPGEYHVTLPGSGITENDLNEMAKEFGGYDADSNCCLTEIRNTKRLNKKEEEALQRRIDDGK